MKRILFLTISICIGLQVYAQSWTKSLENKDPKSLTFFDIQKALNDYYNEMNVKSGYYSQNGEKIKVAGWKQFKRWEWNMDMRVNPVTGEFPKTSTPVEMEKYFKSNPDAKSTNGDWTQMGPATSDGGYAGIGRVNCVAFHPSDNNTYWVGTPSGGLWKTTNDGSTWAVYTDKNTVLGVSDIAIPYDFTTSNTIYIATGDRDGGSSWTLYGGNYDDNASIGVLKSTDGGSTWSTTGLTWTADQFKSIGRLLIHPTNPQILLVGASDGIYKSTNGGTSFTKVNTISYVIDMEFKPGDPTVVYASTQNGTPKIYKSTNTGDSWSLQYTFASGSSRSELAVTANAPNNLYVLVSNTSGGLYGVYKSKSLTSFTQLYSGSVTNHSLLGYYSNGSGDNIGQGGYDLAFAVAPNDSNIMFLSGINTWKSTDGGYNWSINNMWTSHSLYNFSGAPAVHADKHVLKFRDNLTLFEGNDGGIYKSTNTGTSWIDKSNGIINSQIYRLGVSQQSEDIIITGLQDNGTKALWGGTWYDVKGGDGMECIIDPTDDNVQYGTYVEGEIERTLDGWSTYNTTIISNNISDATGGWWVTPYVLDPNNSQTLYVGYADVWKSTNRGDSFTKISTMASSEKLRSLAVAPSNSSYIYAADRTHLWKTDNVGTSWTNITGTLPISTNSITYLAVHYNNPQIIWVTMGGYNSSKVYESVNGGASWSSISTGLPNIPVFCIIQNKMQTTKDELYVGTDRGVYLKNGTDNWVQYNHGLPNVMVTELDIYYNTTTPSYSKIRAATFGRGLWESDLYSIPEIATGTIAGNYTVRITEGAPVSIPYTINTTFTSNTFRAYLSDANGDFSNEIEIGEFLSNNAGTINGTIPANTTSGTRYRIRVKSSSPVFTSVASNAFEIKLVYEIVQGSISSPYYVSETSSAQINIPFTINETFTSNTFTAYMSDANGSFSSETEIGNLVSDDAGTIIGTIPANTASGTQYKVKIKSSSPVNESPVSNSFEVILDKVSPTVNITSTVIGTTSVTPINITLTFNEGVSGFEQSDIIIVNGTISNFNTTNNKVFTGKITPIAGGIITLDVPAEVATDFALNLNTAATQWSINYVPTGIEDMELEGIHIFPIPAKNELNIEFDNSVKNVNIQIIDASGISMFSEDFIDVKKQKINLENFSNGIYIIKVTIDGQVNSTRFVIQ